MNLEDIKKFIQHSASKDDLDMIQAYIDVERQQMEKDDNEMFHAHFDEEMDNYYSED